MAIKSKLAVAAIVFIAIALLQGIRMLRTPAEDITPPARPGILAPPLR